MIQPLESLSTLLIATLHPFFNLLPSHPWKVILEMSDAVLADTKKLQTKCHFSVPNIFCQLSNRGLE